MLTNNFDPVAFSIFSLNFRWYSLAYIFGIIIGWILAKKYLLKNDEILKKFDDYITFLIIGIILGGRLGYVIFYNLDYYKNNILEIFFIWQGGMSFHGGIIGILISSYFFAIKNKTNIFKYLDVVALVAPVGIFFGRVANFINSELYGHETIMPWAVQFVQIDKLYRHPSQLYEALLEGLLLFLILLYFRNKNYLEKTGIMSALFLIFYSLFRFFVEFFRVPDEHLGYLIFELSMGQIISIIFFIFGIILIFVKNDSQKTS